jgi:4,5-dihydroxyphthalate decarboxylase
MADDLSSVIKLRTNLSEYAVTSALRAGGVTSPLVKLDLCGPEKARNGFRPMLNQGAFDAGELALITYLQARAYGRPVVLLPAPISGRLQHHCIGYNSDGGSLSPRDIEGRRVGLRTYSQTTSVWTKGVLQHEYGVDLNTVTWLTMADAHVPEHNDPDNCVRLPPTAKLDEMLLSGEIPAAILGNQLPKDPKIRTLIPDAGEAGQAWRRRTGVMPINHMFAVNETLSRDRPDVVREIYRLLAGSRAAAPDEVVAKLPPMGFEANRKTIETAIEWSYEQRVIPRRLTIDKVFDTTTRSLNS